MQLAETPSREDIPPERGLRKPLAGVDLPLAAVLLVFAAIHLHYLDYVPNWDSGEYAECIIDRLRSPAGLPNLNCFGHPTIGYFVWLAIPQAFFPGSAAAIHLVNLGLGLLCVAAFHRLARSIVGTERRWDALTATACFAAMPVLNANLLAFTADTGVLLFFILFLDAHHRGRTGWALFLALCLVMSKEVGTLLYALTIACTLLVALLMRDGERLRELVRPRTWAIWALPVFAIVFFYAGGFGKGRGSEEGVWRGQGTKEILDAFFSLNIFSSGFRSQATGVFVLQFAWVMTAVVVLGGAWLLWRSRPWSLRTLPAEDRALLFLTLVLAGGFLLLTRTPRTFTHPRYTMHAAPVLVLVFAGVLSRLVSSLKARMVAGSALVALLLVSQFRTIDPVSRAAYGTWSFGRHPMLRMTSIGEEAGGYGLDALVYNYEFTHFHYLINEMLQSVRETPPDVFAAAPYANWRTLRWIDPATFTRALPGPGRTKARVVNFPLQNKAEPNDTASESFRLALFMAYPNFAELNDFTWIAKYYDTLQRNEIESDGYVLPVYALKRRSAP